MSSPRKAPNIWVLASVTYGTVIAVTILSVLAYYYVAPKLADSRSGSAVRSVTVGSVWMPVYPGATLEGTASVKQGDITESTLKFGTPDASGRVLAFYTSALKKGVFRFDTVAKDSGGGTVRSLAHEGKTTVVVTIHATGQRTSGEIRTVDRDDRDKDTHK